MAVGNQEPSAQHGIVLPVADSGAVPEGGLPSASGSIARLACARARAAGIAVEPLLRKAKLTLEQIEDRSTRLPTASQIRVLELVADLLQDPFLGFHLAAAFDPREIGLLHYVLASSETLDDAMQRAARYSTLVNEGVSLKYLERSDVALVIDYVGVARHSDCHQIEFWVTALVRSCRELTRRHLLPHRVQLTHHRHGDSSEFAAFLGCDVEYGAAVDEIAFAREVKDLAVVSADPYLHDLLIGYCEEALARRATRDGGLRSAVENAIAPLLPHGRAHMGECARQLGMSARTLARRLASEGLTFGRILDELRADLAQCHVKDSSLPISQIAWLLGYQEVSAFTHAFKRWTGVTPRQMRAQAEPTRESK
jgi:AraC-like DNA-binding protein